MPAPKRQHSVHVRLTEQEFAALDLLATSSGREASVTAAELLGRALLGEGHALMFAAQRFVRAGLLGAGRDERGGHGQMSAVDLAPTPARRTVNPGRPR